MGRWGGGTEAVAQKAKVLQCWGASVPGEWGVYYRWWVAALAPGRGSGGEAGPAPVTNVGHGSH